MVFIKIIQNKNLKFVNFQVTKACFSSFPACQVLIISMILQPIWPRQLSNAQGKRTAYLAASTVPKCMYQNQEAKYMDRIHLVEARGHHEVQQCNEVPNKIKLQVRFMSYSKCSNWCRISKLVRTLYVYLLFAILQGQIKSKQNCRLVTYKLVSP